MINILMNQKPEAHFKEKRISETERKQESAVSMGNH